MSKIPTWETQNDEKRVAVRSLFSRIAKNYDRANRILSFNRDQKWRELAVSKLELKPGDSALDICCGTGDFLLALRKAVGKDGKITGIDFCEPMLAQASKKDENSTLVLGDACDLPFESETYNGVTIGWGIRNVPDILLAHREAFRVLKSGGRFVSIDTAEPQSKAAKAITGLGRKVITAALGVIFRSTADYKYLDESTKRFKTRDELVHIMTEAGFIDVKFQDLMFGNICIHWGTKP